MWISVPATDARPSRARTQLVVVLGAVTAFSVSIDMYLPALPVLGAELGHRQVIQLSGESFLLGLAVRQGFYGPLADRFGRTRPLFGVLLLFVLASIGCALTPSMDFLIVVRFLGIGACSGQVIARAIVRDLFEPEEAPGVKTPALLL